VRDAPDPVANAINRMLDHIHVMDRRMEAMSRALEEHGITRHFEHLDDLDGCGIDPALPDAPGADAESNATNPGGPLPPAGAAKPSATTRDAAAEAAGER
jgi:hypothetical protein